MGKFRNWQSRKSGEWYSRGYLPHRDKPGLIQAITFHLGDSLAQQVLDRFEVELARLEEQMCRQENQRDTVKDRLMQLRRKRLHDWLDAGHGSCLFQQPELARCIKNVLLHHNGREYNILAWCIMPNHVHVVVEFGDQSRMGDVVKAWKSVSSRQVMAIAKLKTGIWSRDYFDRFIRDDPHLRKAISYTEENPVKAGLVTHAANWQWSSAWKEGR